ncbi:hypothetical protein EVAR_84474_1 [Eumeta japonica]|uniref:Uncharacterized protein n=1 Tax=Eumeta variegata TaxID=151549 RepID=A0A4C1XC11_EUMVA|nr:hypothetical protein EVAR_84474_1 [Eumeta japonica]
MQPEPSSSYEMRECTVDDKRDGGPTALKPTRSAGKIFYNPSNVDDDTELTSVFDSSTVESPMIIYSRSTPHLQVTGGCLHRVPTYSSSIGQSIIFRPDTCSRDELCERVEHLGPLSRAEKNRADPIVSLERFTVTL